MSKNEGKNIDKDKNKDKDKDKDKDKVKGKKKVEIPNPPTNTDSIGNRDYKLVINENYKPDYDNSIIIITLRGWYQIKGNIKDELEFRFRVRNLVTQETDTIQLVKINNKKFFNGNGFNNVEPEILFPIKGRYTNNNLGLKRITIEAKRNSEIRIIKKNNLVMTIEEIEL
jgi:hypothetical protein